VLGLRVTADEELADGLDLPAMARMSRQIAKHGGVDYLNVALGVRGGYVKDTSWPQAPAARAGKIIRDVKLFDAQQPELWMKYNSYASPTPVIEEGRVYVSFGEAGTACLDTKTGAKLWERRDLKCNHYRGAGSSPILFNNLLILHFDGADDQFARAVDQGTGGNGGGGPAPRS